MLRLGALSGFLIATALSAMGPGVAALAQAPPLEPDNPLRPATSRAGYRPWRGADARRQIAWRLAVDQAMPPTRADADVRRAGFILADKGAVALVDQDGTRLARIAPGEAIWTAPGVATPSSASNAKRPTTTTLRSSRRQSWPQVTWC